MIACRSIVLLAAALLASLPAAAQTYAELLGWEAGARVVMFHVDDAGMSHDSNVGALKSLQQGVATSMSVMMPCPWVPELVAALREDPALDAGLHLTLTAEWEVYCWGPLVGAPAAPGLVDSRGCLWPSVEEVVAHASADEVEAEIRAQLARARELGFEPTHLDSHMGTLFATPEFLERYIELGAEEQIPIMYPGGHNSFLREQYLEEEGRIPPELERSAEVGRRVWRAGLPVLDDLHNVSYGWQPEAGRESAVATWRETKVSRYSDALRRARPGVTMIILHATEPSESFRFISSSGPTRKGDLDAMLDPRLRRVIEEEGLILTTWRELMRRRREAGEVPPP